MANRETDLREFKSLLAKLESSGSSPTRDLIYRVSDLVDCYDGDPDFRIPPQLDFYFHGYRINHKIGSGSKRLSEIPSLGMTYKILPKHTLNPFSHGWRFWISSDGHQGSGAGMNRYARIVDRIVAGDEDWLSPDFVSGLRIPSLLKQYTGTFAGKSIWVLKADKKIYRDKFGWISMLWQVSPILEGGRWILRGELSFAPASNGSYANDKFKEFLDTVVLSGRKDGAMFGVERRVIELVPSSDAKKDIEGLILEQMGNVEKARRFWTLAGKETPSYAR